MLSDNPRPFDVSQSDNPALQETFRFFCRHLVCLGGWIQPIDRDGRPKGKPEGFAFSAFVLVIRDKWLLLTAGHILRGLDQRISNGEVALQESYLLAGFGPEVKAHRVAKERIYFDYEKTAKGYIDEDALDFGLLDLGTYLRFHLEKNEVEPVREENWRFPICRAFDFWVMLGFPQKYVDIGEISPTMIYVQKLDQLPDDVEETDWPRFVGKLSEKFPLKSLMGMSGGPIYGFTRQFPNMYWISAIQSGWRKDHKITFGCPVPLLAELAERCLFEEK